ncbi:MAG: type I restriction enzyme R subunit [Gammaproteobacteria bacterium]|jgi:type I restriction enzyme R subunit
MDKRSLSERDISTKFITPAILKAGWQQAHFREEVNLTDGRVMVRGKLAARIKNPDVKGGPKRADYVLYAKPNLAIAVIEAKKNTLAIGHGMQQALAYAEFVENDEIKGMLREIGVDYGQGYGIHKPQPFDDILKN